ncbi:MAG: hypothetical protein NVSMB46_01230 [Candidatus Saccharimonadales bacterium]
MTEHLGSSNEKLPNNEVLSDGAEVKKHLEQLKTAAEHAAEANKEKDVDKLLAHAEKQAKSREEINVDQYEPTGGVISLGTNREIKKSAYDRAMKQVRSRLSLGEQTFSTVIHQPIINSASELGAKTIARPSGILGGGICALIGSSILLYFAKHYGFKYNYLFFIVCFVLGFFIGLLLEIFIHFLLHRKK